MPGKFAGHCFAYDCNDQVVCWAFSLCLRTRVMIELFIVVLRLLRSRVIARWSAGEFMFIDVFGKNINVFVW